jgi:hypothetical protein
MQQFAELWSSELFAARSKGAVKVLVRAKSIPDTAWVTHLSSAPEAGMVRIRQFSPAAIAHSKKRQAHDASSSISIARGHAMAVDLKFATAASPPKRPQRRKG